MLRLKINNNVFDGWTEARITHGVRQASSSFQLSLTDKWQGKSWQIKPFDKCELFDDDDALINGYVDSASTSYDSESHTVNISGRSITADCVDCSAESKQFNNQTIQQIATELAKPFGVAVVNDVGELKRIKSFKPDEGSTVFESIERLARLDGLLVTDDANGNIVLTRAGEARISTPLVNGENILSASASYNVSGVFSDYIIKGQQKGGDDIDAATAAHVKALVTDSAVIRHRPLLVMAESQVDIASAKIRGEWEKNARFGNSQSFTVTVQGWRHANGLWRANNLVKLKDAILGVDADFLIAAVTYSIDDTSGTLTQLDLAPRAAFIPEPLIEKTAASTQPTIWKELSNVAT